MRFLVLGPLEVFNGHGWGDVPSARLRSLLAFLLLNANVVMPTGRLVEELWGQEASRSATNLVQQYVLRLRRTFGCSHHLVTRPGGYELALSDGDELDSGRFVNLLGDGRAAFDSDRPQQAAAILTQSLELWRGPALSDVAPTTATASEAVRLDEQRTAALELRVEADLACGRHDSLIGELRKLVGEHPLRERLWSQLMIALYRAGRQADALAAYREVHQLLDRELSVRPGPELDQLHRQILNGSPALAAPEPVERVAVAVPAEAPPSERPPPRQLPADLPGFTGRNDALTQILNLMPDERRVSTVIVSVIGGCAGVGKTALAIHAAHRLADRFPDGQLYVNLRGFDDSEHALDTGEAIRALLDALGVAPHRIPPGLDAQAALYRSHLAGRRVLLLLDNARTTEQVRPLLPGAPGCMVLVTSRDQLSGLVASDGAHPLTLDRLTAAEARALLVNRLGHERVDAAPEAASEIVDLCACLPLALAVVAARAATYSDFSLEALAGELRAARAPLDAFTSSDPTTDMRSVFSWSYRTLGAAAARLFRLLCLHPSPDLGCRAIASLAGLPLTQTQPLLAELTCANLLTEHRPGRYTCHDLLRAYASELMQATESEVAQRAATHRLLDHYLHSTHTATLQMQSHRHRRITPAPVQPGVTCASISGEQQAMAWFTTERSMLLTAVRYAASAGFDTHTWQLASLLEFFLGWRGYWHDWEHGWEAVQHAAIAASRRQADGTAEAHAHRSIGHIHFRMARYAEAHAQYQQALALFETTGDCHGQAMALLSLGTLLERQDRQEPALAYLNRALDLFVSVGSDIGRADALNALGWLQVSLGGYTQTLTYCREALGSYQELGDRRGEAAALDGIGMAHHRLDQHDQAVTCYGRSLDILQQLGDRYCEATVLTHLGDAHYANDMVDTAHHAWQHSLTILEELDHPDAARTRSKLRALDQAVRTNGPQTPQLS